ncbi:MAG: hypothetical protein DRP89_07655 [Candidatus Neomarinimicrobiota bacterium]|nr:MAG: hypothetical protein DRP89_07655 [Candidatus Neomarinimicrobiota bacterium]
MHLDFRNYPNQNADLTILNPRVRKMYPAINVGIEDLYIGPSNSSATNGSHIRFSLAAYCWVSNIESKKPTYYHISISKSMNITVYGSYFHKGNVDYGPGKAYGIFITNKSTSCLVENNIFYWLRHGICLAGGANGNVYGYNFSYRTVGDDDPLPDVYAQYTDFAYSDIFLHGHYPFANLIEGNVGHFIYIDQCWGKNGPFNMIYKNATLNHDESYGLRIDDNNPEQNVIGNYIAFKFSWIAYAAGYPQGYEIYDDNVYEYHNY